MKAIKPILALAAFLLMLTPLQAQQNYEAELYVEGIDVPWGMAWLPNGDMLVTERSGSLFLIRDGEIVTTIGNLPDDLEADGQGGFLDVEVHPNYEENGWVYFSYSYANNDGSNTAIVRAQIVNNALGNIQDIYKGEPTKTGGRHFGSRIEFDRDGFYFLRLVIVETAMNSRRISPKMVERCIECMMMVEFRKTILLLEMMMPKLQFGRTDTEISREWQ